MIRASTLTSQRRLLRNPSRRRIEPDRRFRTVRELALAWMDGAQILCFWASWNALRGRGSAGALAWMACRWRARHRRLCMAGCTRTAVGAYGTGVGWCAPARMAGGVHGFPAALMSSACRAGARGRGAAGGPPAGAGDWAGRLAADPADRGGSRGGRRAGARTGCGWRQRRTLRGWPAAGAGTAAAGHGGMPGRPRGAGGPGRPGMTCRGVAA